MGVETGISVQDPAFREPSRRLDITGESFAMRPFSVADYAKRALELSYKLRTPDGISASLDEKYRRPFGRDTYIMADFVAGAYEYAPDKLGELWDLHRFGVVKFWEYQGSNGKAAHEVSSTAIPGTRHLTREGNRYVNRHSIDVTPIALFVTPEYVNQEDPEWTFLFPKQIKALRWMTQNMDENNGWLSFLPDVYKCEGWMDSRWGAVKEDGSSPEGPVALVDVQGPAWKALRVWSDILEEDYPPLSKKLRERADDLKKRFNEQFIMRDEKGIYFAHALIFEDKKNPKKAEQIKTRSLNPGLNLWASYRGESIIDERYIDSVVSRLMDPAEFFAQDAGVRTFASGQRYFDPEGYHNAENVFWTHATLMIAKSFIEHGYYEEAKKLILAGFKPIFYFDNFIETFNKNGSYALFRNGGPDGSCLNQGWALAGFLWAFHHPFLHEELQRMEAAALAA